VRCFLSNYFDLLLYIYLCTKVRADLTGRSTISGLGLAWFSFLSSVHLCIFGLYGGAIYVVKLFLITSFSLPFSELCLVGLTLDVVN